MGITVNLDADLVKLAKTYSAVNHRSIPKQIEYWAKIGRIAEENPDLNYHGIYSMLLDLENSKNQGTPK